MSKVMQLMICEGIKNGGRYQWLHFFDPAQEIIDEFEKLANKQPSPPEQ
jgi:hypothetical protein